MLKESPFEFNFIDNFLEEKEFNKLLNYYYGCEFKEYKSDLYQYLSTKELANCIEMDFLKEKISKQFSEYKDTYFNIFDHITEKVIIYTLMMIV
ncbi:hypothetical protein HERIO_1258 [Hepatospora eriocheir]|uniref:BTB domain-containing protein n=1 Tax=Hepatospora eriocheir TaxID=1081669 RepID=A0A1X0QAP3_9MICR|nr:hypothetical protein HERIO_1258 [Hepatospora eriocheir]